MSIEASSWAWQTKGLSASQKLVLLALADHADQTGICWPGQNGIASKTCLSIRTVKRARAELESIGLIQVERRGGSGEGSGTNRYFLNLGGQNAIHTPPVPKSVEGQNAKRGRQSVNAPRVKCHSTTQTTKNHHSEPPLGGCGLTWPEGLFSNALEKIVLKIEKLHRQSFLDEVFEIVQSGKITSNPERYAAGMVKRGWMPSEGSQASHRGLAINQRVEDILLAVEGGAQVMIDGVVATFHGRFVEVGKSTMSLGFIVGGEIDGKIKVETGLMDKGLNQASHRCASVDEVLNID